MKKTPGPEERISAHIRKVFPDNFELIGEKAVAELARAGVRDAWLYGMRSLGAMSLYVDLMLLAGSGFARDPQLPWAIEPFSEDIEWDTEKMRAVSRAAGEYFDRVGGKGGEHFVRATTKIRRIGFEAIGAFASPEGAADLFGRMFPEKLRTMDKQVPWLWALAERKAQDYGMSTGPGAKIYAALLFTLGAEIDTDPAHPWVADILRRRMTAAEKARALYEAAMTHTDKILAMMRRARRG